MSSLHWGSRGVRWAVREQDTQPPAAAGWGHSPLLGPPWTSVPAQSALMTPGCKHTWHLLGREPLEVPRWLTAGQTPVAEGGEQKGVLPVRCLGVEKNLTLWSPRVATVKVKPKVAEKIFRSFLSSDLGILSKTSLRANTSRERAQPAPQPPATPAVSERSPPPQTPPPTDTRGCHNTHHHTRSLSCLSGGGSGNGGEY